MLMIEFSIYPVGQGESMSKEVAKAIDIIDRSGLAYRVGPMGTCIEGEWSEVMEVVRKCYEAMSPATSRLTFNIKGDSRPGKVSRLDQKVDHVESSLGRTLKR